MSVMKWTMVLELEDGELSVGCNEQNFYLIIVLFFLTKVEKDSNIRTKKNNNNKKKKIIKKKIPNQYYHFKLTTFGVHFKFLWHYQ